MESIREVRKRLHPIQSGHLLEATVDNDVAHMKRALRKGANPNARRQINYYSGFTPLMIAIYKGHKEAEQVLRDAGATISAHDMTVIHNYGLLQNKLAAARR